MIEWMKQLADLTSDASSEVTLTEVKYSGVIGGSDYFISTDDFKLTHPLYEYMQGNEYLKSLSQAKPILVHRTQLGKAHISELKRTKIVDVTSIGSVTRLVEPGMGITDGSNVPWRDEADDHSFDIKWTNVGIDFTFLGIHERLQGDSPKYTSMGPTGQPKYNVPEPTVSESVLGPYPSSKDANDWFDELKYSLNFLGALGKDRAEHLGCTMHYLYSYNFPNPGYTIPGVFKFDLPVIVGYRRWATTIVTPTGLLFVGGYLFGEGDDFYWSHFGMRYTQGSADNFYSAGYPLKIRTSKSSSVYEPALIKRSEGDTFDMMWPLSWNSDFVNSMALGELTSVSEPAELGETKSYIYTLMTAEVLRIDGQMTIDGYARYLTGIGVYKGAEASKVADIRATWANLPSGVAFAVVTEKCSGRSVKETLAYNEYGRKRAKACKDNNFMELPYNDTYTWKQVDNMMSNLTSRSVWVIDASNAEVTTSPDATVPSVTKVITFSPKTDTSVGYTLSDGGGAGTLVLTAENFTNLAEQHMPFRIQDSSGLIDPILKEIGWTDVATFNAESDMKAYNGASLGMGTRAMGKAVTYEDVCLVNDVNGEIAYLASQICDFRQFNTKLLPTLRSLLGSSVYPKLVDAFVKPEEA